MTEFFVSNSLNLSTAVKFNMTLVKIQTTSSIGRYVWVVDIGTTRSGITTSGIGIGSNKIYLSDAENIDEIIEQALPGLCKQIDWSPFERDKTSPYIVEVRPIDESIIGIDDFVNIVIRDDPVSAGIDLSSMKMSISNGMSGFDITNDVVVEGDGLEYSLTWNPPTRVRARYDD